MSTGVTKRNVQRKFKAIEEVLEHKVVGDLWVLVHGKVYDLSTFNHPGGMEIILKNVGQDAKNGFDEVGHSKKAMNMLPDLCIGEFVGSTAGLKGKAKPEVELQQLSLSVKFFMIVMYASLVYFLYWYISTYSK